MEGIHVYAIFRAKITLVVTAKYIGYHRGKTETCYVYTNNVHTINMMNGYQIVIIDGYDRPETKCHGTATMPQHENPFCNHQLKKIFTIGNS